MIFVEKVVQMESNATVSIIMPAYNAARFLRRAVASVLAQTYADWELIVVDDGSRDDTWAVASALAQDPRIMVLSQPRNTGAAKARNRAIAVAKGRYIAFLDADDEWSPDKLALQTAFMQRTGATFSFTGYWREREGRRRYVTAPERLTRSALLRRNRIGCLTAVYDRAHLGTVLMPDMALRQDYALWLDLLLRTDAHGLNQPLATLHQHRGSLSSARLRAARATWAMYRNHAKLPPVRAAVCLLTHLTGRLLAR
jgi:teichuronic acid biosynthesis glycosyltransferase TuaG